MAGTAASVPVGRLTISLLGVGRTFPLEVAPRTGSAQAAEMVPRGGEVPRVGAVGVTVARARWIPVGSAGS
jgi:hypothetical protein